MPRLFIVDPSLKDIRGHHYMMTRAATLSAQKHGYNVYWLCSKDFSGELNSDGAIVQPTFGSNMYQNYMQQEEDHLSAWSRITRWFIKPRKPQKVNQAQAFYDDLQLALQANDAGAGDRIFLHTADGASFRAIANYLLSRPENVPIFHVATPYDPVGVMPNREDPEEITKLIQQLRDQGMIDKTIFLYAENTYLAEHLSSLWSAAVRPLDVPVYPSEQKKLDQARQFRKEKLNLADDVLLAVSLGSARMEKGFYLIPDIVRRTFEFAGTEDFPNVNPKKIKYVLHASPQIVGRDPVIVKAIDKLKAMPDDQIELLLEPLSEKDYQSLLYASDIVLMPYNEKEYRVRGSTIVSEAIAAAKIIVAREGSYPAKAAQDFGGETGDLPIDMARGVLKIASESDNYKARAQEISIDYVARNGIETYWQKCLETESSALQAAT